MRFLEFFGASCAAALAAGTAHIPLASLWWGAASLPKGIAMAVSDSLIVGAIAVYVTPAAFIAFLLGSLVLGAPAYLALRHISKTGPVPVALTGALLSGLAGWIIFRDYGAVLFAPPVAASGAIGALAFRAVTSKLS
ncbi:hypothetical protein ABE453_02500 [Brevundimonas diminuta]|uniref:hypothetical protein n=1 Tax=Brevundimonas diminuta TaxID=293 RepID=UPI003208101B